MIPLFDLRRLLIDIEPNIKLAFEKCLNEAKFINGPEVRVFESKLAEYMGIRYVNGVSNGTDALLASFMALNLNKGDEILVTPFTFVASATSIVRAGLKPVFVDLAEDSFHPSIEAFDAAMTPKTRGILAVHLFGEPSNDLQKLREYCDIKKIFLIEDCAQAMGTTWKGDHVGTYGHISTFSFFPAKNLGCFGDGGAVATHSQDLAERVKKIRSHGSKIKYEHEILGGNFRLDTIQAAILGELLPELDSWLAKRKDNAEYYTECFRNLKQVKLPKHTDGHSWNQYTLRTDKRDELKKWLDTHQIGNAIYYPKALHKQKVFDCDISLPEAEKRCNEVLSLPIYPGLSEEERDIIVETVINFFTR
jgi:dTDP-4-amino-4,6-dideoxygalactose transaminase